MDVLTVLKGVLGGHTKVDGKGNTQFLCISCHHKNKKLAVNIKTLMFQCWVCGERGSIANYLFRMGHKDVSRILKPRKKESSFDNLFGDKEVEEEKQVLEFSSSCKLFKITWIE